MSKTLTKFHIVANACGTRIEDDIYAIDKFDATDVFRIYHDCYKVPELVDIISVEEAEKDV